MSDPFDESFAELVAAQAELERILGITITKETPIYDKGSWVVTYLGGTTPGTTTYAANGQVARWTRLGRMMFVRGRLEWTAATGTGNAQISLPFAPVNVTNLGGAIAVDTNNVTFTNSAPQGLLQANTAFFLLRSPITNAGSAVVQMEAAGIINFGGLYEVAT